MLFVLRKARSLQSPITLQLHLFGKAATPNEMNRALGNLCAHIG